MEDSKQDLNEIDVKLNEQDEQKVDSVSYETHKRTLAQRAKLKEEKELMSAELEKFKTAEQEREENKLKEQGEYKKLLEAKEGRIKELEADKEEKDHTLVLGHKLNAFREALPGELKKPEYYDLIMPEIEALAMDPETRLVDGDSLKVVVEKFVSTYGQDLIKYEKGKGLPNNAPANGVTPSYVEELKACKTQGELDAVRRKHGRA